MHWAMIIIFLLLVIAGVVYTYRRIKKLLQFYHVPVEKRRWKLVCLLGVFLVLIACINILGLSVVVVLYIIAFFVLLDIIALIVKLIVKKRQIKEKPFHKFFRTLYGCGILPFLFAGIVFGYGYYNVNHIIQTDYVVETTKDVGEYKIVLITDTHYDTIQNPDLLKEKIAEINELQADIIILGGDIVDESTSKESMQEVFARFGELKSKYGIYYVYGNHDKQPYSKQKTFTEKELEEAILGSGIQILDDRYVEINEDLVLAGRKDASWRNDSGRASVEELLKDVDRNKFIIMADHQPLELKENDAQGVDLEVAGHTHGGQIWPIGLVNELTGTPNYGEYQSGDCRLIVSSGFTGWGYPIRTGKHCEYVVIQIGAEE